MRTHKPDNNQEVEMDMTPMIDVVFNLIIFFMLVTQMVVLEKTELILPKADQAQEDRIQDPKRLIINILDDGRKEVRGAPISDGELTKLLYQESRLSQDDEGHSNRSILIRADKKTPYKHIARVIMECVRHKIWRLNFAAIQQNKAQEN